MRVCNGEIGKGKVPKASGAHLTPYVAARLGRSLFQGDRPELLQSVNEDYASLQRDAAR